MQKLKNKYLEIRSTIVAIAKYVADVLIDAVVIILIVVVIRNFLISPFQVNGSSMVSTLFNNDYIFVEKLSYKFDKPKFGDIIIFEPPIPRIGDLSGLQCFISHLNNFSFNKDSCKAPDLYIKRVIGIPGDEIKIENGAVYRNGKILDESAYLDGESNGKTYLPSWQKQNIYKVPENSVLTLGDNRNGSSDSRYWKDSIGDNKPFVSYDKIEGKFFFRLFSPNKIFN